MTVYRFDQALHAHMAANVARHERLDVQGDGLKHAAVALTIVGDDDGEACFLITRRPVTMRRHAAQWALPGGRLDAGETPEQAALRELREELGYDLGPERVLGRLDDFPSRSGYLMTPVVVWGDAQPALTPDPGEVEFVWHVPLALLDDPSAPTLVPSVDPERPIIQMPLPQGRTVHAPTAAIIYQLREVALHGRPTRVAHFEQPGFAWR